MFICLKLVQPFAINLPIICENSFGECKGIYSNIISIKTKNDCKRNTTIQQMEKGFHFFSIKIYQQDIKLTIHLSSD